MGYVWHGGGIKGAAHVGVLKALEEEKIDFEYIAGTSSGSIVATLYASGYNANEIYELFKQYAKKIKCIEFKSIVKMLGGLITKRKIVIDGLNTGKVIEKIIQDACEKKEIFNIKDIQKNLIIPSVDLNDGTVYLFSSIKENRGYCDEIQYIYDIPIGTAVRGSCSYPRRILSMSL